MFLTRNSLPIPPDADVPGIDDLSPASLDQLRDQLIAERAARAFDLEMLDAKIQLILNNTCAPDRSEDVEKYKDGDLGGMSRKFVDDHQKPVGQLQWLDLTKLLTGPGDSPGSVSQRRWSSGALIGPNLFLTAGHSFETSGDGWTRPRRKNVTLTSAEMAVLTKVNFNFEIDPATGQPRPDESFPVVALREFKKNGVDYAILELGPDNAGRVASDVFGTLPVAAHDLTTPGAELCFIHHPDAGPKRVDAGPVVNNAGGIIFYAINAGPGSSGAPILSADTGELVGIHIMGGCMNGNGAFQGQAIGAIRAVTKLI